MTVVVVGASVGGAEVARELRAEGYTGRVVLLDQDPDAPYDKPPLSKQLLAGSWSRAKAEFDDIRAEGLAEVWAGRRAAGLDLDGQRVLLDDGAEVAFDHVVIATGAAPIHLRGEPNAGVFALRTMGDCDALRARLTQLGGPLVVVGAGLIGCEVSATVRSLGVDVALIEATQLPMVRTLGPVVGEFIAGLHADHGVDVRCGVNVVGFGGSDEVESVVLGDGSVIPATTVVIGLGVSPNVDWLASEPRVPIDGGVLCDEYCRVEGTTNAHAIGDVAVWRDLELGRHRRVEHWSNAVDQARLVARNIVHPDDRRPYREQPYFWSDQFGVNFQMYGRSTPDRPPLVIRNRSHPYRSAFVYTSGPELVGALTCAWPAALLSVRRLVKAHAPADELVSALCDAGGTLSATSIEAFR